ncbi:MAG: CDF family Co(II)/Ni(II) efflux transporter DmeF [Alphaproteobacteria bacterium]|nr:CDF family Co(II)/Ni(II) efflux transporter DmeF [Alphaproteobacteria bacterium]
MHTGSIEGWTHGHVFLGAEHGRNERRIRFVVTLCCTMMVAEIVGGLLFRSMALVADGLHMSTHAVALLIGAAAYAFARRHAADPRFSFGTGKFGDLAGFTSAIILAMIALLIGWESLGRLPHPVPIAFAEAIPIAAVGLGVNLLSAWLLRDEHDHDHSHAPRREHSHAADREHGHPHRRDHDLNLRAAYLHVAADAAVSLLAVVGLFAARQLGWPWIDAVMGMIGAAVILNWAVALMRAATAVLLDIRPRGELARSIRERLERGSDRVADLHLWQVGPGHNALIATIVSHAPQSPSLYKEHLAGLSGLSHVTIEVERRA